MAQDNVNALLIDYDWCTGCHSCEIACQTEHNLPLGQYGIKIAELGPWEYAPDVWQYTYVPLPTDQCDLCAPRVATGKTPSCVKHCQAQCMEYGSLEEMSKRAAEIGHKAVVFVP